MSSIQSYYEDLLISPGERRIIEQYDTEQYYFEIHRSQRRRYEPSELQQVLSQDALGVLEYLLISLKNDIRTRNEGWRTRGRIQKDTKLSPRRVASALNNLRINDLVDTPLNLPLIMSPVVNISYDGILTYSKGRLFSVS